jgi:hypothetical protein
MTCIPLEASAETAEVLHAKPSAAPGKAEIRMYGKITSGSGLQ